jgi:hypothetical protein
MATKDISDELICRTVADMWSRRNAGEKGLLLDELLAERTGQPIKVCFRAMERACRRGLIEYGMWLQAAWLTDRGKALLS